MVSSNLLTVLSHLFFIAISQGRGRSVTARGVDCRVVVVEVVWRWWSLRCLPSFVERGDAIYWNAKGVVHYNCKFRYILIAVIYSK